MRRVAWLAAALALAGCRGESSQDVLHVYAASSLTEAFTALKGRFEAEHPGVEVGGALKRSPKRQEFPCHCLHVGLRVRWRQSQPGKPPK